MLASIVFMQICNHFYSNDTVSMYSNISTKIDKNNMHGGLINLTFVNGVANYTTNLFFPFLIGWSPIGRSESFCVHMSNGTNGVYTFKCTDTPNFVGDVTFSILYADGGLLS